MTIFFLSRPKLDNALEFFLFIILLHRNGICFIQFTTFEKLLSYYLWITQICNILNRTATTPDVLALSSLSRNIFFMKRRNASSKWKKKIYSLIHQFIFLINTFKGQLSDLKQFWANESPLKMMKNVFCFTFKASLVLNKFKFLSWIFGHAEKWSD